VLNVIYLTAGAVLGTYLPGFFLAYLTGLFTSMLNVRPDFCDVKVHNFVDYRKVFDLCADHLCGKYCDTVVLMTDSRCPTVAV